jgi:predicted metal-dependent HD superfamily phosphohydrolase
VLRVLTDVADLLVTVPVPDAGAVRFAAWFHDAIYDARCTTNEEASAHLARRVLDGLELEAACVDEVARLVLLTAAHDPADPSDDPAAAVMLDADLAVLGSDPATYAAYVNGVRAEYAHVDDAGWRSGRAAVLRHFLDADRIYATEPMRAREHRARANIAAELATLERQPT